MCNLKAILTPLLLATYTNAVKYHDTCDDGRIGVTGTWGMSGMMSNCWSTKDHKNYPACLFGSHDMGGNKDTRDKNTLKCHTSKWEAWGAWGTCSKTCGGGVQQKTRKCTNDNSAVRGDIGKCTSKKGSVTLETGATLVNAYTQEKPCNAQACLPVYHDTCDDGRIGVTGTWGRSGMVSNCWSKKDHKNYAACPFGFHDVGGNKDTRDTYTLKCHTSKWEAWGAWGTCSKKCGGGVQQKTRKCTNDNSVVRGDIGKCTSKKGSVTLETGATLLDSYTQEKVCNTQACLPVYHDTCDDGRIEA
eukprot:Pgem_evm1s3650